MKKHEILLKNQQLRPQKLDLNAIDPQTQQIPEIWIKIPVDKSPSGAGFQKTRKYIFLVEETDQETPLLKEGDQYCFQTINKEGSFNIKCLTFPKLQCMVTINPQWQKQTTNKTIMNIPGLEGLEAVEEEKEEQLKEDNYTRQQINWVIQDRIQSPFGTPTKPQKHDLDRILETENHQDNIQTKYLKYFKEEFKIWKDFFEKKEEEEEETPKKEKPKSQKRKNSASEEKIEESWTKRDKNSPFLTLSSGSPSNYENFSFDDRQEHQSDLLYSHQDLNDREEEQYDKIKTMKKTNSQYHLQFQQRDTEETQTLSFDPKQKQKKKLSLMEWASKWSSEKTQVKIKHKEDSFYVKQHIQHLKNSYSLCQFLHF